MTFTHRRPLVRCASMLAAAVLWAAGAASGQTASTDSSSTPSGYSSSQSGLTQLASLSLPSAPVPAAAMGGSAGGQYGNGKGYSAKSGGVLHRLTFEAGGGAAAPAGDKADITWGGQFLFGGGVNITNKLAAFLEFQFLDNKLPGAVAADAGSAGGNYHIEALTIEPVYDVFPKSANDLYLRAGGGYYHKSLNFTDPTQSCGFFYYYYSCGTSNQTIGSFSSNNGGFDVGAGYQHRFGGMYGQSRIRLFAEVRYLDVLSPALRSVAPAGSGLNPVNIDASTKLMPITLGIRW